MGSVDLDSDGRMGERCKLGTLLCSMAFQSAQRSAERLAQICVEKEAQADAAEERLRATLAQTEVAGERLASLKEEPARGGGEQRAHEAEARAAEAEEALDIVLARLEEARALEARELDSAAERRRQVDIDVVAAKKKIGESTEQDMEHLQRVRRDIEAAVGELRETQDLLGAARRDLNAVEAAACAGRAERDRLDAELAARRDAQRLAEDDRAAHDSRLEGELRGERARCERLRDDLERAVVRGQLLEQIVAALKEQSGTLRGALEDARAEARAWRESVSRGGLGPLEAEPQALRAPADEGEHERLRVLAARPDPGPAAGHRRAGRALGEAPLPGALPATPAVLALKGAPRH
ncbi:hypothetical protein QBZ16_000598 [Prototheca wickerhamii]|uniref:Uncharacterized protein n=1 Tax=Prototheca wickerhamii TaxID=3111 RepID=A0AAD9MIW4_PROWI|nr:hypothetical protein QBZ16_000598 [Prototheca wickerhamii]